MAAALAAIAAVLVAVLLLLAVPVAVDFRFQHADTFQGQIKVRWLFGLVRLQFGWTGVAGSTARAARPGAKAREASAGRASQGGPAEVLRVLRDTAFRRRILRLVRELVEAAHLQRLVLHARLGLGDPADTGRLWAWVGPLSAAAQGLTGADLRIEPEFVDPVFEFDARGGCRLVPLQLLALALAFLLSPATVRAWRTRRTADG